MNEKKIEPTDAMIRDVESWGEILGVDDQDLLRYILNHPDAAGLFECDHTDYVHVDEAATRVEAAREEGWDGAAQWLRDNDWGVWGALCAANPHRHVQELPTASCAVIVPADGRERVEAMANVVWYANEAVLGPDNRWHGVWRADSGLAISSVSPKEITPGTWQVADQ